MHQNLVEREDLKQDLKLQALAELGQDYLKAGLLDRAEEAFDKLRDSELAEDAKRNLLEIYQLEKDWEKAIAIASELPDFASHKEVAEYYCELAAAEMIRSRRDLAAAYLQTALERNRKCVRASLLQGDIQLQQDQPLAAIESWQRIEQQDPTYLALVAQRLLDAFRKLDRREEGLQLLRGYLEHYPSLDLLDVVFQLVLEGDGPRSCVQAGSRRVEAQPDSAWIRQVAGGETAVCLAGEPPGPGSGKGHRADLHPSPGSLSVR
jgi:lipopolysaccharide biosynthesis regulator YciM